MFKKSVKSNIRKRRETDEDLDEYDNEPATNQSLSKPADTSISAVMTTQKEKPKKNNKKKVSLLSFGDEEEEDNGFQLKKSSRSKRIAKKIKKRLQEERESLTSNKNDIKPSQPPAHDTHLFQSQKTRNNDMETNDSSMTSKSLFESDISRFNSGAIPSPSMIHAARKQREMLRKFGSEHISIDDTQKYKERNQSRLVRDEDDDGSSDDGVIEMKGIEKEKVKSARLLVPNESDDDVNSEAEDANADEEVHRWEEEMIKKGINLQTNQMVNQTKSIATMQTQSSMYGNYNYVNSYYTHQGQVDNKQMASYRNIEAKSDVTFDSVKKRLQEHLTTLKERYHSHQNEMSRFALDAKECKEMFKNLGNIALISEEYQFYQEMRQYLKDLIECLKENIPVINNLEQSACNLWKNQSDRLSRRHIQDVQDESLKNAPTGNKTTVERNNGSDTNLTQRIREREARRMRRRATRQIHQTNSGHNEGMSTDDEETSMDQAQHNTELQHIQAACNTTFNDVLEDFCSLKFILKRFEEWRHKQKDSYNDAYIALCIPNLIVPFIKHMMVLWNPLLPTTKHFEEEEWFKQLSLFGLQSISLDEEHDGDSSMDDIKVLSSVIEKVIIVKVTEFMDVWNPLSSQQTIRICLLLKHLMHSYPCMSSSNSQCQLLVRALCKQLQNTLDNHVFIPLFPSSAADDNAQAFLDRQTWTSIKLFRNAMLLHGILSYDILCEMAFDALLNRYIMLALQTCVLNISCVYKCQRIVDSIPKSWFNQHENISSYLSSLTRFLVHFAQSIKASGDIASKTMCKQIKSMLLVIRAREAIAEI